MTNHLSRLARPLFVSAVFVVLLCAPASAYPPITNGGTWAGDVTIPRNGARIIQVETRFTAPKLDCAHTSGETSTSTSTPYGSNNGLALWAGIDGVRPDEPNVEQAGIWGWCTKSQPKHPSVGTWKAFTEMFPDPPRLYFTVHAGDVILAQAYNFDRGAYHLSVRATATRNVTAYGTSLSAPGTSGEIVGERPRGQNKITHFYGSVVMAGAADASFYKSAVFAGKNSVSIGHQVIATGADLYSRGLTFVPFDNAYKFTLFQ